MRLFVALNMQTEVLQRLADLQDKLRHITGLSSREVKWVRSQQMHLTLKFLGAVDDKALPQVCAVVQETANHFSAFDLLCRGIGVFGKPARVVWAGIEGDPLLAMQRELDDRFSRSGWATENRAFTPHLTLCRVKSASAGRLLAETIAPFKTEVFGRCWIEAIAVYESRLSAAGPEYRLVSRSALR